MSSDTLPGRSEPSARPIPPVAQPIEWGALSPSFAARHLFRNMRDSPWPVRFVRSVHDPHVAAVVWDSDGQVMGERIPLGSDSLLPVELERCTHCGASLPQARL